MTDRPDEKTPDQESTARDLRDLPQVEADATFRDQLRQSFVSGEIEVTGRRGAPHRRSPVRRLVVPLALAAAAVIAFMLLRPPRLRVLDVIGDGVVRVDGRAIPTQARDDLAQTLREGAVVEVGPDVTLDLIVPKGVVYELGPGTRMTIPQTPGRWSGRAVACSLSVGELRLRTGRGFNGAELTVHTPDGVVVVTGTLLSIAADAEGTCVCVLEGTAAVGVDVNDLERVTPGYRKVMLKSGEVSIVPVKPMHRDGVLEFDARIQGRVE
jgi:hypothetical protein